MQFTIFHAKTLLIIFRFLAYFIVKFSFKLDAFISNLILHYIA